MTIKQIEGIIISNVNYGESSKIINVISKEHGKVGIIAKGCRQIKSKFHAVTNKLIYGRFNIYYKEDGLSTLISVDIINPFFNIVTKLDKITYATYLLDLTNQVLNQCQDSNAYDDLIAGLLKIEDGLNEEIITLIIELKYLDYLGVKVNVDNCAVCGSDKAIVTFDSIKGGYVCCNCYENERRVSDKAIKLLRLFYYVDLSKISKIEISSSVLNEINTFLEEYYEQYTGLYLKSKKFLKSVKNIV